MDKDEEEEDVNKEGKDGEGVLLIIHLHFTKRLLGSYLHFTYVLLNLYLAFT